ncbi:inositol monophosphatase [Acetobacteraceae bacterium]|nr:inositol monophosphatase [Acetobacteraceae bacterium]
MRLSPHMAVMHNAATKAGRSLLRDFSDIEHLQVNAKAPGDFVSQADLKAEKILKEELEKARPGYAFLMEESGESGSENWTWRWIVDPLDGTSNFLHGIPQWAVSIGLQRRHEDGSVEIIAGVVYNPVAQEMYWAEKGLGAFLNDRRIRVSGRARLSDALIATGIPFAASSKTVQRPFLNVLATLMPRVAGIRRFGAAALDLAGVACGRFDGFWEYGLKPWDCAAGIIIIREAGGHITDPQGKQLDGNLKGSLNVVSGNQHLFARLQKLVDRAITISEPQSK